MFGAALVAEAAGCATLPPGAALVAEAADCATLTVGAALLAEVTYALLGEAAGCATLAPLHDCDDQENQSDYGICFETDKTVG